MVKQNIYNTFNPFYLRSIMFSAKNIFIFLVIVSLLFPISVMADIAVIVNSGNKVGNLSKQQVVDIFMGRNVGFPDGSFVLPFDLPVDNEIRKQFYEAVAGKTIPQINAYWARLIFSGRATPPRVVKSTRELLNAMKNNKNGIAYIDSALLNKNVKVVLIIDTKEKSD